MREKTTGMQESTDFNGKNLENLHGYLPKSADIQDKLIDIREIFPSLGRYRYQSCLILQPRNVKKTTQKKWIGINHSHPNFNISYSMAAEAGTGSSLEIYLSLPFIGTLPELLKLKT